MTSRGFRFQVVVLVLTLAACGSSASIASTTSTPIIDTTTSTEVPTTTIDPRDPSGIPACAHVEEKIFFDPYGWDIYDVKSDAEIDYGKQIGGTSYGMDSYLRRSFGKYINVYNNAIELTSNPAVLFSFQSIRDLLTAYLDSHEQIPYPDFEESFDSQIINAVRASRLACDGAKKGTNVIRESRQFRCDADTLSGIDLPGGNYSAPPDCINKNATYKMVLNLGELNGGVGGLEAVHTEKKVTITLDSVHAYAAVNDLVTLAKNRVYISGNIVETRSSRASFNVSFSTGSEIYRSYNLKQEGGPSGVAKGSLIQLYDETDSMGGPAWFIAMSSYVTINGRYAVIGAVTSGYEHLAQHIDENIGHGERSAFMTFTKSPGKCCNSINDLINLTSGN